VKLIRAQATNYRNIIDSNPVEIGQSTCLVGKNEAGKSAFLKALEGLRSTDKAFTEYGKITNYPRRAFADYAEEHGSGDTNTTRTVKKAEAYFRLMPPEIPEFSHYDPAAYLLQHPKLLSGSSKAVKETLARFEKAFQRIGEFAA
jgi:ATPase subunit of ABC transporter with duplicated ATPase domains